MTKTHVVKSLKSREKPNDLDQERWRRFNELPKIDTQPKRKASRKQIKYIRYLSKSTNYKNINYKNLTMKDAKGLIHKLIKIKERQEKNE